MLTHARTHAHTQPLAHLCAPAGQGLHTPSSSRSPSHQLLQRGRVSPHPRAGTRRQSPSGRLWRSQFTAEPTLGSVAVAGAPSACTCTNMRRLVQSVQSEEGRCTALWMLKCACMLVLAPSSTCAPPPPLDIVAHILSPHSVMRLHALQSLC